MARNEGITYDAFFYDASTKKVAQIGISPRLRNVLEGRYADPNREECSTFTYKLESWQNERKITFTDVLVVEVSGPARKPPKTFIR